MSRLVASGSWLVIAGALAGWALLCDWWVAAQDAVDDEFREVRYALDDDPDAALARLDGLRALFERGEPVELDADAYFFLRRVRVPSWRVSARQRDEFARTDAEVKARLAQWNALRGGAFAPLVRALGALSPSLAAQLPYDPVPPVSRWVVYTNAADLAAFGAQVTPEVEVSKLNLELDPSLLATAPGPDVGFAYQLANDTEITGTSPAVHMGNLDIPAMPQLRTTVWWVLGRTSPPEVLGVVATGGASRASVEELLRGLAARRADGPPAGSASRPGKAESVFDAVCRAQGKPPGCLDDLRLP